MKHARIQRLLSSFGADATRWPEPERITAQQLAALLADDAELAAAFADATAVDAALNVLDRAQGGVDDLRAQRLLQSLQVRTRSLPQVAHARQGEQIETPTQKVGTLVPPPVAFGARRRHSYSLAWAAMLPLLFGFLAGMTSEVGDAQALLERSLVQTPSSSLDTSFADETMMAPFVAAAAFDTESGGHN